MLCTPLGRLVLALVALGAATAGADPCGWQFVNSAPPEVDLFAIAFGGGRYVAVGDRGLVSASDDGLVWRSARAEPDYMLIGVAYGAGNYVAFGRLRENWYQGGGIVISSPDGHTWTRRWFSDNQEPEDVAWHDGRFVVALAHPGGGVLTSEDGTTWVWVDTGFWADQIEANDSELLALGNATYASRDGLNWERRGPLPEGGIGLAWGEGHWLATGGYGSLEISTDGSTWEQRPPPQCESVRECWAGRVAAGGGMIVNAQTWCYLANSCDPYSRLWTSTDWGSTWSQPTDEVDLGEVADIAWDGLRFIAVTAGGDIVVSSAANLPDPLEWTCGSEPCTAGWGSRTFSVTATPAGLIAFGDLNPPQDLPPKELEYEPFVSQSQDGVTWEHRTVEPGQVWPAMTNGTWGVGTFAAIARDQPFAHTSPDGWTWERRTVEAEARLWDIEYGPGSFVVIGKWGFVASSVDAISWTPHASGTVRDLTDLLWDGSRFLAAGKGVIVTSADGVEWSVSSTNQTSALWDLLLDDGQYLALAEDPPRVVASSDGLTWTNLYVPGEWVADLATGGGLTVASSSRRVHATADRVHWTTRVEDWYVDDIVWAGDAFVGVGSGRVIVRAECFGPLLALDPPLSELGLGDGGSLTLTLDAPASADLVLSVSAEPAGALAVPVSVTVPQGSSVAPIPITALAEGSVTVRVVLPDSLGGGSTTATVEVLAPRPRLPRGRHG